MTKHQVFMDMCLEEALSSLAEGGIPIGAVLVEDERVVSRGHNRRVQDGDATAHGEIDCIRRAGRRAAYERMTLYSSSPPCFLCCGAIVQFGIGRVVTTNYESLPETRQFLLSFGVDVLDVAHQGCQGILEEYAQSDPDTWMEDIGAFGRKLGRW